MPACEISSWTLEDKIRIHARPCNILYIFRSAKVRSSVRHFPRLTIAPFTLPKILGTVRIKTVRVPENVALIRCLHTLFSAGPSIAKFVLVRVPGSSFWPADIHGTPAHMRHFLLNMAPYWVELLRILSANLSRPKAPKARQKMWDRLGQSFTLDILSEPCSFFWYKYPFYPCSDYLFSRPEHG